MDEDERVKATEHGVKGGRGWLEQQNVPQACRKWSKEEAINSLFQVPNESDKGLKHVDSMELIPAMLEESELHHVGHVPPPQKERTSVKIPDRFAMHEHEHSYEREEEEDMADACPLRACSLPHVDSVELIGKLLDSECDERAGCQEPLASPLVGERKKQKRLMHHVVFAGARIDDVEMLMNARWLRVEKS
ncbi:hypothetical protein GUITHDRAFT_155420 [Guillardia theta CCMP2712]|uniref:Uncharacterized protein n=2 Tax=Guillardia theta TaxID=55529 RepID=L1IHG1_GUITC|nr:hypothetical protein GUITHDRAFT_155420 [Guillardia theta CCMP2712]EKX35691.1 hypothetical protein GUITHDRAFT_155420 [Guillardia theta CCMP2712]|eukprot:XP_005822671.1 hypothetical protein GUITHDRAFT_155420 [Guillardia theta CCMP2712]